MWRLFKVGFSLSAVIALAYTLGRLADEVSERPRLVFPSAPRVEEGAKSNGADAFPEGSELEGETVREEAVASLDEAWRTYVEEFDRRAKAVELRQTMEAWPLERVVTFFGDALALGLESGEARLAAGVALESMAEKDPSAAVAAFSALLPIDKEALAGSIAEGWTRSDPLSAWDWIESAWLRSDGIVFDRSMQSELLNVAMDALLHARRDLPLAATLTSLTPDRELKRALAEKIPAGFEQVLERVPRLLPCQGEMRFRGWWWVCPGLLSVNAGSAPSPSQGEGWDEGGANDTPRLQTSVHSQDHTPPSPRPSPWEGEGARHAGCGRLVRTLYAPLPVRTVGRYYEIQDGLKVEGLSGAWLPGVMDRWAGRRRLACEHCWKLRRVRFTDHRGWNELVSYLSGGLLYGREVEKPSDFEYERRVAYKPRRASSRRGRGMGRVEPGGQTGGVAGESVG